MIHVQKNVWIIICSCLIIPALAFSENTNEAIEPKVTGPATIDLLKDGKLDAWKMPSNRWSLKKGVIIGDTGGEELSFSEWLFTKQKFSDFEFTCELRLTGDNHRNTGIYYRVKTFLFQGYWDEEDDEEDRKNWKPYEAPSGYEMDAGFHDPTEENYWGSLGDWYARRFLRIFSDQDIINQVYKPEQWNRMTIRTRGNRMEYWINGTKVMDFRDPDPKASREGIIGFQIHDGAVMKVEYRNVRILPLPKLYETDQD